MPAACITASKFLRWWSGLVVPSPLNLLTDRAALTAWAKSCLGPGKGLVITPPRVGNGVGTVGKVMAGNPLTGTAGTIPGEPSARTPTPEYTFGQGLYPRRLEAKVTLGSGTKDATPGWLTLGGDAAARLYTDQDTGRLRTGGVGNKGGIGIGPSEVTRWVVLGRDVSAPKLNVGVPTLDTGNKVYGEVPMAMVPPPICKLPNAWTAPPRGSELSPCIAAWTVSHACSRGECGAVARPSSHSSDSPEDASPKGSYDSPASEDAFPMDSSDLSDLTWELEARACRLASRRSLSCLDSNVLQGVESLRVCFEDDSISNMTFNGC
ncbi:hypothetical protein R1flu_021957 [Riccia fluitans]|uniref:Uncharacterized protein n=1 Tax=Riccia fluitans TaxID=41844 RepID=A0ABD1ZTT3_9MARC